MGDGSLIPTGWRKFCSRTGPWCWASMSRRCWRASLAETSECFFPDGDLENLSHYVQAYYRLPTYITPVMGGYSAGATLAYATAAQAPPGLFAGVLTLGFTPDYESTKPFCKGEGVHFVRRAGWQGADAAAGPEARAALGGCARRRRHGLPGTGRRRLHPQDPQRPDFADSRAWSMISPTPASGPRSWTAALDAVTAGIATRAAARAADLEGSAADRGARDRYRQ